MQAQPSRTPNPLYDKSAWLARNVATADHPDESHSPNFLRTPLVHHSIAIHAFLFSTQVLNRGGCGWSPLMEWWTPVRQWSRFALQRIAEVTLLCCKGRPQQIY